MPLDFRTVHESGNTLEKISARLFGAFDACSGSALYVPSQRDSSYIALHGVNARVSDFNRFDKYLLRRRLPAELSSATAFGRTGRDFEVIGSQYTSFNHRCVHMKLGDAGVLQLVFDGNADVDFHIKEATNFIGQSHSVSAHIRELSQLAFTGLNQLFEEQLGVLPHYQENMVVVETDLSGFSDESQSLGQTRMEIFAMNMREVIAEIADKNGGRILQHQGDGVRIGFDIDDESKEAVTDKAKAVAGLILAVFPEIVQKYEPSVKCNIRAVVRSGEVIETKVGYRGFVFSDLARDLKSMDRNKNALVLGNV